MTLTHLEIEERKEQLRQEILERECLLAALEVLHKHVSGKGRTQPIDVGALLPVLLAHPAGTSPARHMALLDSAPPAALPPPPPPEHYIHPDLQGLRNWHGATTDLVQWAIARLTGDYTLQDIRALLTREGRPLQSAEISVVLSRLKKRGKITEIRRGNGRKPALFRQPQPAGDQITEAAA